jgi:BirA family biotin operon repressor/biotin-[acetyl-CoA-carboxylase] ligase
LRIYWLDSVDSTQRYLIDALRRGELHAPVCVAAKMQHSGKGSRGNSWEGLEGNLFFSFAIARESLPDDLRLESSSIYFTYLLKEALAEMDSELWLKWPNDFYLGEKKIGGAITNLHKDSLVCGIGMNIRLAPPGFGTLDIDIERNALLETYFEKLEKKFSWKHIFSKYKLEFDKSRTCFTHHSDQKVSLEKAILLEDGSIECEGQRIFSLR